MWATPGHLATGEPASGKRKNTSVDILLHCVLVKGSLALTADSILQRLEREKAEMKLICAFFAALTALLGSHDGFAQSAYPDKAIRILVGFPPGGPPDIAARLLADKFAEAWGKPVLVENATGAGGNVAVDRAAKATPDGYTLVVASSAITINPSLYEKLPYDPVKDLAPISLVISTPSVLVVHSDVPAKNVPELVALT